MLLRECVDRENDATEDKQRGSAARIYLQPRAALELVGCRHALNWCNTDRRVCGCATFARKGEYFALISKKPSLKSVRGIPDM